MAFLEEHLNILMREKQNDSGAEFKATDFFSFLERNGGREGLLNGFSDETVSLKRVVMEGNTPNVHCTDFNECDFSEMSGGEVANEAFISRKEVFNRMNSEGINGKEGTRDILKERDLGFDGGMDAVVIFWGEVNGDVKTVEVLTGFRRIFE